MLSLSFIEIYGALITWLISSSLIFSRYLLIAGFAYLLFYSWKRREFLKIKIQKQFPTNSTILFEIKNSIISSFVFGLFILVIVAMNRYDFTMLYYEVDAHGYLYLFLSWLALVFFHDAYFYWTHRLMHHPKLFSLLHNVHHQSFNPTPWASFSFHPLEAIVEFAFLPVAVCLFPIHPFVIFLWSMWMIIWNVLGHLGFELFPKGAIHHPFFKWFNTSTHHNLHHQRSRGNFGLYFNFWDRMMHTNDETYEKVFTELKS